ncbi:unnamed protein product [marine sediment metagenome]|uniref:Uncharacterized protein n=1 Tax=marine sediment metagenome TaxID=412755 RepID=X1CPC0_9ZZZZ
MNAKLYQDMTRAIKDTKQIKKTVVAAFKAFSYKQQKRMRDAGVQLWGRGPEGPRLAAQACGLWKGPAVELSSPLPYASAPRTGLGKQAADRGFAA